MSGLPTHTLHSGGQTGADRGALEAARSLGLVTGGWAAKGWMTERGPDPTLATFGLRECPEPGYPPRTRRNVADTDGTIIVGDRTSRGSAMTIEHCDRLCKPRLVIHWTPERGADPSPVAVAGVRAWLVKHGIGRLNVAGNRESKAPGIQAATEALVRAVLLPSVAENHPTVRRLVDVLGGRVEEVEPAR